MNDIVSAEMLVFEGMEYWWSVIGSRAELCELGHCVPSHFPIGRKRVNYGRDSAGRDWCVEAKRGGQWLLKVGRTPDER